MSLMTFTSRHHTPKLSKQYSFASNLQIYASAAGEPNVSQFSFEQNAHFSPFGHEIDPLRAVLKQGYKRQNAAQRECADRLPSSALDIMRFLRPLSRVKINMTFRRERAGDAGTAQTDPATRSSLAATQMQRLQ